MRSILERIADSYPSSLLKSRLTTPCVSTDTLPSDTEELKVYVIVCGELEDPMLTDPKLKEAAENCA
jgi:hypothetical protein